MELREVPREARRCRGAFRASSDPGRPRTGRAPSRRTLTSPPDRAAQPHVGRTEAVVAARSGRVAIGDAPVGLGVSESPRRRLREGVVHQRGRHPATAVARREPRHRSGGAWRRANLGGRGGETSDTARCLHPRARRRSGGPRRPRVSRASRLDARVGRRRARSSDPALRLIEHLIEFDGELEVAGSAPAKRVGDGELVTRSRQLERRRAGERGRSPVRARPRVLGVVEHPRVVLERAGVDPRRARRGVEGRQYVGVVEGDAVGTDTTRP